MAVRYHNKAIASEKQSARWPLIDPDLADQLLARAEASGVELLRPGMLAVRVNKLVRNG